MTAEHPPSAAPSKEKLLRLLNTFLKHNSKARKAQKAFESSLESYIGAELSDVMDIYIDMELSGAPSATEKDIESIIEQAREGEQ